MNNTCVQLSSKRLAFSPEVGKQTYTHNGDALQRPRDTYEGCRGPLAPPSKKT